MMKQTNINMIQTTYDHYDNEALLGDDPAKEFRIYRDGRLDRGHLIRTKAAKIGKGMLHGTIETLQELAAGISHAGHPEQDLETWRLHWGLEPRAQKMARVIMRHAKRDGETGQFVA